MRFKLIKTGSQSDVLGGPVSEDHVYLSIYAQYEDRRHTDLDVDEWCHCTIRLSGEKGAYTVVRIADENKS